MSEALIDVEAQLECESDSLLPLEVQPSSAESVVKWMRWFGGAVLFGLCLPLTPLGLGPCVTINEGEQAIVLNFGR